MIQQGYIGYYGSANGVQYSWFYLKFAVAQK